MVLDNETSHDMHVKSNGLLMKVLAWGISMVSLSY